MKLYPIPGGTWAGTEAAWKTAMKAKGLNPKEFEATKTREVPVAKADLIEFLNFYSVDVYRLGDGKVPATTVTAPDVDALRALHNPTASDVVAAAERAVAPGSVTYDTLDPGGAVVALAQPDFAIPGTLDREFAAAPIGLQLSLATVAIDNALAQLAPR